MIFILLKIFLSLLAGVANAIMDTLDHHYSISIFRKWDVQYWGPTKWENKYHRPKWLPILLMDGWHLCKSIMLNGWVIAIALPSGYAWYWNALACRVLFAIAFQLTYAKLFIKK